MIAPTIENPNLTKDNSHPRTVPVRNIAAIFIAGPAYKNAVAGPIPAPLFQIPANNY